MSNVTVKSEIKTIDQARQALSKIPYINQGGCGISALALHRWIKKNANCNTVFVFGDNDVNTYKKNMAASIDVNDNPGSAAHVGLIIYDYDSGNQSIVDCNSVYNMARYEYLNVTKDEAFVVRSINQISEWNPAFERNQVKVIAKTLDIDLSDIDIRSGKEYADVNTKFRSYSPIENDTVDKENFMKLALNLLGEIFEQ